MMTDNYTNSSQQTLMTVITVLSAHTISGQTLAELNSALEQLSRDQIFRALKNLEQFGWAQQSGDLWRLAPSLTQISEQLRIAIADIHHTYLHTND